MHLTYPRIRSNFTLGLLVIFYGIYTSAVTVSPATIVSTTGPTTISTAGTTSTPNLPTTAEPTTTAPATTRPISQEVTKSTSNPQTTDDMTSVPTGPMGSGTPVGVLVGLALLGVLCLALVVMVIILAFFARRQQREMNSMKHTLAALDCHIKTQTVARESKTKDDNDDPAIPALPDKKRKGSAAGRLEGTSRHEVEHIYNRPPNHNLRKPSLPVQLPIRQPFTSLEKITEEPIRPRNAHPVPPPPALKKKSFQDNLNLEIPAFAAPPRPHSGKTHGYINQMNTEGDEYVDMTSDQEHIYDMGDDKDDVFDYENMGMARLSNSSNKENAGNPRQMSDEYDEETAIDEPVYGNKDIMTPTTMIPGY